MKNMKKPNLTLFGMIIAGILIILVILFFVWEWHLIRTVAIAFMPVASAEALAWLGIIFNFGLAGKSINVRFKRDED